MKILQIIYDDVKNPWLGGGGALRAREINRLLAKKHSICMLTGNFPGAKSGKTDGIEFRRIGFGKQYFLSRLTFALLVPFSMRKYDVDIVVNEFSVFSPVFCQWLTRKPVIHTFYHHIGRKVFKKFWFLGVFAYMFEKIFLMTAKNLITISPGITKEIFDKYNPERIECILTGVDSSLFDVQPAKGEYIAFLGRLDIYMKGIDTLLEAFYRLSDKTTVLKIAGAGRQKNLEKIKTLIKRYSLADRVNLVGRITDNQKKSFLRNALFVVMPSRFEGWGITAIEAAACGKAVIGTNIPGLNDAVISRKTGLLTAPDDPEALALAMETLLRDEELVSTLGKNGREWAHNFRWETIAEKQEAMYYKISNKNENEN